MARVKAMMKGDLRYGLASKEDGPACNALNNSFFKRNRSLSQWEWEFLPPHLPFERIPYAVARDGDKIVGTQGLIIIPMLSERGPFWTAKGEDTIVHPRYWGRDALTEMYKILFSFCEECRIPLLWGLNNREGAFSRAGFQYFASNPSYLELFRPLDHRAMDTVLNGTAQMKKRFDRPGGGAFKFAVSLGTMLWADGRVLASRVGAFVQRKPRNLVIEELTGPPGEEFDALSYRFVKRYGGITLHRTGAFLKWRLLENPFLTSTILTARLDSELCGYMALTQTADRQIYISDYFVCAPDGSSQDDAIIEFLTEAAISEARAREASVLRASSFNAHVLDIRFRNAAHRMGFFSRALQMGACYRLGSEAHTLPDTVADYGRWFVTSLNTEGRKG